jgi:hypothetical protein
LTRIGLLLLIPAMILCSGIARGYDVSVDTGAIHQAIVVTVLGVGSGVAGPIITPRSFRRSISPGKKS